MKKQITGQRIKPGLATTLSTTPKLTTVSTTSSSTPSYSLEIKLQPTELRVGKLAISSDGNIARIPLLQKLWQTGVPGFKINYDSSVIKCYAEPLISLEPITYEVSQLKFNSLEDYKPYDDYTKYCLVFEDKENLGRLKDATLIITT